MGVGPQKLILLLLPAFSCGTPRTATPPRAIGHRVWQQAPALQDAEKRPSTENCTWRNFTQSLGGWRIDHFGATEGTFPQRLCIYDHWWRRAASGEELPRHKTSPGPIFFYTGNESPVGVYVNQTGLMWELAPSFGALIVMLAGWMRMKMPEVIDGAIAASAPIWQLATTVTRESLDWPYQAITRGVSSFGGASERCVENLRVAWPLIEGGLSSTLGLSLLSKRVHSCEPLQEVKQFTAWAQETYFLLAEGNYPFPSSYIPTAVGEGGTMPAWPMRVACEPLSRDFGFRVESGELEKVHYTIRMGDLKVTVHWDQLHSNGAQLNEKQLHASGILELAAALADSVAVWYNVSKTKMLGSEPSSPAAAEGTDDQSLLQSMKDRGPHSSDFLETPCNYTGTLPKTFAWTSIVCNEDLSQVSARGLGHDFYWPPWPPAIQRNYTVASVDQGLRGAPMTTDLWSTWLTAYYGDRANASQHRNIVWSNGALDPWSGMGVYPPSGGPTGPMVQEMNVDGSTIALVLDLGAHHLDLMFSDPADPPCAHAAREIERQRIRQWCEEAYQAQDDKDGTPNHYDFYLGRHEARDRLRPGEFFIVVPIAATLVLMCAIMSSILVRDWAATKKSISGMAEMIGKSSGNRASWRVIDEVEEPSHVPEPCHDVAKEAPLEAKVPQWFCAKRRSQCSGGHAAVVLGFVAGSRTWRDTLCDTAAERIWPDRRARDWTWSGCSKPVGHPKGADYGGKQKCEEDQHEALSQSASQQKQIIHLADEHLMCRKHLVLLMDASRSCETLQQAARTLDGRTCAGRHGEDFEASLAQILERKKACEEAKAEVVAQEARCSKAAQELINGHQEQLQFDPH
eukprot:g12904.t1